MAGARGPGSTARRLLVAAPDMLDPNFARAVVFMVEHDDGGALGIILNHPSETPPDELDDDWRALVRSPELVFVGGPVQLGEATIAFARATRIEPSDSWEPLVGRVGSVDLGVSPFDVHAHLDALRVFSGYSGWAAGQLDHELSQGGWHVVDADPEDLLTPDPANLWRRVLRRQGGALAIAANQPADPTVN
jgi:putative transcriptional regulator